jgi:glycosyltransferase involved in cell wall biosynthesis
MAPTHLLVHGPMPALIRWALRQPMALGVVMADSFANPFYRWWRFRSLPRLLRHPRVTLIANHGLNAARAVVDIGVPADRVLAWDYPHVRTPDLFPPKPAPGPAPRQLLYVGSISAKKGVGDLLRAMALLKGRQDVRLTVAGGGQVDRFARLADKLGLSDAVRFLGLVPNGEIPALMHAADAVVVPSRHSFPEGLPLTLYEALASRTPVIASDHPMFAGHLDDGESAILFPAGRPRALADAIDRLFSDASVYARVSQGAPAAWARMQNPVKWGDMIDHWVGDGPADRDWLAAHSVASLAARGLSL